MRAKSDQTLNLSDSYNGMDEFMRVLMRIANQFENWACEHIEFNEMNDVWPYLLEDKFGKACLDLLQPSALMEFEDKDCLRVALRLRLPVIVDGKLPIPFDLKMPNPFVGSEFKEFRIQTIRDSLENGHVVPFVVDDEPFDEEFDMPYFGIYGLYANGELEHIADRGTYADAVTLLKNLVPGISLEVSPVIFRSQSSTKNER